MNPSQKSLKHAGIVKMLVSRFGIPPSEMILNGPNADRMKRMPSHISARLPNKPKARVIPIMDLTPADVDSAKTLFYIRATGANYGHTKFEIPDPRIHTPLTWYHKGKTTMTMDIMDMASVPNYKTYEQIIEFVFRGEPTNYAAHFVIDAVDINDAIQRFTSYATSHPLFYRPVKREDVLVNARTKFGMRAGTRKRKSKVGAKKRKHNSKRKSKKKTRFSKK
jgi:hypothetical protein